jgi:hypothetical protein
VYVNSLNLIGVYEWEMIEPVSDFAGQMHFGLREKSGQAAWFFGRAKTAFVLSLFAKKTREFSGDHLQYRAWDLPPTQLGDAVAGRCHRRAGRSSNR